MLRLRLTFAKGRFARYPTYPAAEAETHLTQHRGVEVSQCTAQFGRSFFAPLGKVATVRGASAVRALIIHLGMGFVSSDLGHVTNATRQETNNTSHRSQYAHANKKLQSIAVESVLMSSSLTDRTQQYWFSLRTLSSLCSQITIDVLRA
jgi:hypothetical protein